MLRFVFGEKEASVRTEGGALRVGVPCPVLSGPAEEAHDFAAGFVSSEDGFTVVSGPETTLFAAASPMGADDVEAVTRRVYAALFRATRGRHLYRVWHFVPGILTRPEGREETYRRFCVGRAEAFDAEYAAGAESRMSAASATGCDGDRLVVVAVAGTVQPEYFENPLQTPAYRYPRDYGPRSPSFARASRVRLADGGRVFVSGTAAVLGSASMHAGDLAAQIALTDGNIRRVAGLASGGGVAGDPIVRVYVKSGVTPPDELFAGLGRTPTVIRSDVCRDDLLVEAEVTFAG